MTTVPVAILAMLGIWLIFEGTDMVMICAGGMCIVTAVILGAMAIQERRILRLLEQARAKK
jgi:hypothetical protein